MAFSHDRSAFYLTTSEGSPYEQHLWRVPVKGGARTRLTMAAGLHAPTLSPDEKWFADVYSYVNKPPELYVQQNAQGADATKLTDSPAPEFHDYAVRVVANAAALGDSLAEQGFRLVSGGTENHQVLVDLGTFDAELTGKVAQETLDRAGITCNRNTIPDDPRSPFVTSGLRLGTAALTTTGMGESEMSQVGALIGRTLRQRGDEAAVAAIRAEVAELCAGFPPYPGLAGA